VQEACFGNCAASFDSGARVLLAYCSESTLVFSPPICGARSGHDVCSSHLPATKGNEPTTSFIRKPDLPGVDTIHLLIEGIYKPAWSDCALSIASMLKSPCSNQTPHNPDGTWWMLYSPKADGMTIAANASLIRCMTDSEPLLVVKQVSDKSSATGARHRLLGLGLVALLTTSANSLPHL